jgi:hypothetical protein
VCGAPAGHSRLATASVSAPPHPPAAALGWSPDQPSYDGSAARLAALRAGEPVDIAASDLPPYARAGMACHWWTRAVVDADGAVMFYDDETA